MISNWEKLGLNSKLIFFCNFLCECKRKPNNISAACYSEKKCLIIPKTTLNFVLENGNFRTFHLYLNIRTFLTNLKRDIYIHILFNLFTFICEIHGSFWKYIAFFLEMHAASITKSIFNAQNRPVRTIMYLIIIYT